jgi:hypothetical protein
MHYHTAKAMFTGWADGWTVKRISLEGNFSEYSSSPYQVCLICEVKKDL